MRTFFHPIFRPLGVDLFCLGKKFLVYNLVSRNLKIKYRRSILGVFWTLLAPIAMACIYYFVFKIILNVQIPHYLVFILSGMLPWSFFSQTLTEGMESIVVSHGLISKIPIPLHVFPFVGAITNLVTLGLAIPILLGAGWISNASLGASLVLLPALLAALFLVAYGMSLILAIGYVYFRDLRHLVGILMQLWFYATPVVYDESMVPEGYRWVFHVNPVGGIFRALHAVLVRGEWIGAAEGIEIGAWAVGMALAAVVVRRYMTNELVERI